MDSKTFFVIGMRRSGTSILRRLIMEHTHIEDIKFEPHELMFAASTVHIKRYSNNPYHKQVLEEYRGHDKRWYGAKFALNAGIEALHWRHLYERFHSARFIFIRRNMMDVYNSWVKQDEASTRGVVPPSMYEPWWGWINASFEKYLQDNPQRGVLIEYEALVENADREMQRVWRLLGIPPRLGFNEKMRTPENWSGAHVA